MDLKVLKLISDELEKAKKKWPNWLDDPVHAAGIVSEESGELVQASNDFCYGDGTKEQMVLEACHTAATAIRFLEGIDGYERVRRFLER